MSRKKRKKSGSQYTGDEWLTTYSDTITLILTFFILLYTFSTINAQKFKSVAQALESVLSGESGETILDNNLKNGEVPIIDETPKDTEISTNTEIEEIYEKVKEFVAQNNLEATVTIEAETRGVVIRLKDSVLFESGKADILKKSLPLLDKLNGLINAFQNRIVVEGHTDNVPISTKQFPSNWELSTQRAVNVLKYFVETKGGNPVRFQAAGYGEYHPLVKNDSGEHRAMNRRVNILIVANEKE